MKTKTKTVTVKTPGQIDFDLWWTAIGNDGSAEDGWHGLLPPFRDNWERHAASLPTPIQPLTEEVPVPTDGELLAKAINSKGVDNIDDTAAEFLRLLRERDGEPVNDKPLAVTEDNLLAWRAAWDASTFTEVGGWTPYLAAKINTHRGVREIPKVTAAMMTKAAFKWRKSKGDANERYAAAADYLNAELAKAERKDGA